MRISEDLEMKYVLLRSIDEYCIIHFCTITIVKMQQHESILFLFVTWPLHQVTNFGPPVTNWERQENFLIEKSYLL